jgi:lycopene beta-cyclase
MTAIRRFDVAIAGGGPVAWATAVACAERGLTVVVVSPEAEPVWKNTYGLWADDLEAVGLTAFALRSFNRVVVGGNIERRIDRGYALVDNDRLAASLLARAHAAGVATVVGRVAGVAHDLDGCRVAVTSPWCSVVAVVAIDATGSGLGLRRGRMQSCQLAYGRRIVSDKMPYARDTFVLMDARGPASNRPATFLYAFDCGDGTWFVEQTVLATTGEVAEADLANGLEQRLVAMGVTPNYADDVIERVRIPMGRAVPKPSLLVRVGAAGGAIHPGTGYSLGTGLRQASIVASALTGAFDRGATPVSTAVLAWAAVWSPGRRRARALLRFGHGALTRFDQEQFREFLDAFFALDRHDWSGYLAGPLDAHALSPREVAAVMTRLYRTATPALRSALRPSFTGAWMRPGGG